MKLEVGMYVRTKKGKIYKFDTNNSMAKNGAKKYMVNCSYNIIDILEEGDILVDDTNRKLEILLIDNELMVRNAGLIYDNNYYIPIKSIAIKSVVTKEQFESMKYSLEG